MLLTVHVISPQRLLIVCASCDRQSDLVDMDVRRVVLSPDCDHISITTFGSVLDGDIFVIFDTMKLAQGNHPFPTASVLNGMGFEEYST